jgi:hypothetical protein
MLPTAVTREQGSLSMKRHSNIFHPSVHQKLTRALFKTLIIYQDVFKQAVQKQVEREAVNAYPMALFRDTIFRNLPTLAPLCMNWGFDVSTGFPSTFLNEYRLTLGGDEKVIVVSLGNDYLLSARIEDNPEETEHNVLLAIHELEEYKTTF